MSLSTTKVARIGAFIPALGCVWWFGVRVVLLVVIFVTNAVAGVESYRDSLFPIPLNLTHNTEKAALGRLLFFDRRLSGNNMLTCHSCHDFSYGGASKTVSTAGAEIFKSINPPSIFNTVFNFRQTWIGSFNNTEQLIDNIIQNKSKMASNWTQILGKLDEDEYYNTEFARIYPLGMIPETIKDALAEYVNSLLTPDAPFDRYLRGDNTALSPEEKKGLQLFNDYGCVSCHQGVNIGGNMFQRLGMINHYFHSNNTTKVFSTGRFKQTGRERDLHVFRVPSLRNVALTAPYFHDGSIETLEKAVEIMGRYQLGRELNKEEIQAIVVFLKTLTGVQPEPKL